MEEMVPQVRPDALVFTVVQLKLGPSLGYGEVKPRDDSTAIQSLCTDTMKKLTVLSRDAPPKKKATQLSLSKPMVRFNKEEDFRGRCALNRNCRATARIDKPFSYTRKKSSSFPPSL